ncbi:hypothetical protein GIB67_020438 [Kingdonia uniflora]|uniref:Cupin type-1 domain-containing protein n=1 Tax=Kingdonia uniflora TaxID=39325 RepID=A0A7J7LUU9_9MAGN|nr:hypothetical protein GIB67_020438 [Kingdonia uniflora]
MVFKMKLPLLLLLSIFLLSVTLSFATRESQQCQRQCQQHQQGQGQEQCRRTCEKQQCQRQCQQHQQGQGQEQCQRTCEKQQREREQQEGGGRKSTDPQREFQQCKESCQQQQRGQQQQEQQRQCIQQCDDRRKQQEKEQQQQEEGGKDRQDPQRKYQECQHQCQQESRRGQEQQQQECQQRCEKDREDLEEQQRQQEGSGRGDNPQQEESEEQQQQQQDNNPYYFDQRSFKDRTRTQDGYLSVLPNFSERSEILRGLENYRLAIFEANPNTFWRPDYWDADTVMLVVKGRGTLSLVQETNKKERYNLERGDVIRIHSGAFGYIINRDNNEKLQIVQLIIPVSIPGQFREFYAAGGDNPESLYKIFSDDIMEAALNTPRDQLEKLFGKQRKGAIIKASQEQIRALSRHASSSSEGGSIWPIGTGSQSRGPINLLNKRPTFSNNYGKLHEVDANDCKNLKDLDVSVIYINIYKGSMMAPFYNSESTRVILVNKGRGRIEMICPHLERQSQRQHKGQQQEQEPKSSSGNYQRVSSQLSPRTAFVIPAGHPFSIVADENENLEVVVFGVNAQDNQRNFLAGNENVINQLEKEAKELSFNVPAREVDAVFNNQEESVFLPGPNQRQQKGKGGRRDPPLESILNFGGF